MSDRIKSLRDRVEAAQALAAKATPGPWSVCPQWGEVLAPSGAFVVAEGDPDAHLMAAAPDLVTLATDLLAELEWQDERHGTRAEQEAEEAADDAEWAEIEAMPKEQIRAELAAEGIDPDEADRKGSVFVRALTRRISAVAAADRLTIERDEARAELEREQALRCEAVKTADNLREELGAIRATLGADEAAEDIDMDSMRDHHRRVCRQLARVLYGPDRESEEWDLADLVSEAVRRLEVGAASATTGTEGSGT